MLQDELKNLLTHTIAKLADMTDEATVRRYEFDILGRKGSFTLLSKRIGSIPAQDRRLVGQLVNSTKQELEKAFRSARHLLEAGSKAPYKQSLDVTLPGIRAAQGHLHLVTQAIHEIEKIFTPLGFSRMSYPELEWDHYAFESLNMPKDHPARDEWETFFISEKESGTYGRVVLTPHTSSGQVREMEKRAKRGQGVRMINIAKCYRRQIDISHLPMFHQFEGLAVDRIVTMRQLIGTIQHFVTHFFGKGRKARLRPYHFRFTEPSFEIDVTCGLCLGRSCAYCKDGWSEIGGAGMVHPHVLTAGGYDPDVFTGFAFGFGVERSYLMKNNVNIGDLRLLYANDIRFLEQF
ncbi:phenylalanine--tRNA ligase subunit alpha [Candidatus Uhrbacteria bacterium]|nr:phenylalanine--tRNA ligase subunit alpha [Candidatus Uhrbacteria bacterium]